MLAVVAAHIDLLEGDPRRRQGPLDHRLRVTDKGVDCAVGGAARIDVEQGAAGGGADGLGNQVDDPLLLAFREIGDTFDDLFHDVFAYLEETATRSPRL